MGTLFVLRVVLSGTDSRDPYARPQQSRQACACDCDDNRNGGVHRTVDIPESGELARHVRQVVKLASIVSVFADSVLASVRSVFADSVIASIRSVDSGTGLQIVYSPLPDPCLQIV